MAFELAKGFSTWGPLFGFAGIVAGFSNALLEWAGERKKWIREMKLEEWGKLIPASEDAVNAAHSMPRSSLARYQVALHGSSPKEKEKGSDEQLLQAQALHQEAAKKVVELYSLFNTTVLIFPELHSCGAISAHGDFRAWFFSEDDPWSEAGGKMIAALRRGAYEDLAINLSFMQRCQRRLRRIKHFFFSTYPDHLGKLFDSPSYWRNSTIVAPCPPS